MADQTRKNKNNLSMMDEVNPLLMQDSLVLNTSQGQSAKASPRLDEGSVHQKQPSQATKTANLKGIHLEGQHIQSQSSQSELKSPLSILSALSA